MSSGRLTRDWHLELYAVIVLVVVEGEVGGSAWTRPRIDKVSCVFEFFRLTIVRAGWLSRSPIPDTDQRMGDQMNSQEKRECRVMRTHLVSSGLRNPLDRWVTG